MVKNLILFFNTNRYMIMPILYIVFSILFDVFMFLFMGLLFPSDYIFSLIIIIIISLLLALIKNIKLQVIMLSILLFLHGFLCICNITSFINVNEIFSLESFSTIFMAVTAKNSGTINMFACLLYIIMITSFVVCGAYLVNQNKNKIQYYRANKISLRKTESIRVNKNIKNSIVFFALSVLIVFSYMFSYTGLGAYNNTYFDNFTNKKFAYDTFLNRMVNLTSFGSHSFYLSNTLSLLNLKGVNSFYAEEHYPSEIDDFEYETINTLNRDNNLIMILMETFQKDAIHPLITPNLVDFLDMSTSIDGYYAIERTCMTDYLSQTGMHAYGSEMWNTYPDTEMPMSLANTFKRSGYESVNAFHNFDPDFYARETVFTQSLGFDNFYGMYDMAEYDEDIFSKNKDSVMFESQLSNIAPSDESFYSYIISISTHSLSGLISLEEIYPEEYAKINANIEELSLLYPRLKSGTSDEVQRIKNYVAGAMNFDAGFGLLIERLKNTVGKDGRKLIDSTAIVMFGDHYYYGAPNILLPENQSTGELGNKLPFIIYNPNNTVEQRGIEISKFTSNMDIYKTVASLFGVPTNTQYTLGVSALTSKKSIGIGYLNSKIWGEDWIIDFSKTSGEGIPVESLEYYKDRINQSFEIIIENTELFKKNEFKDKQDAIYIMP